MSGGHYDPTPGVLDLAHGLCPCDCGRPVPKGRRWATASCGNKARAAKRRERCPELRPETVAQEIWEKLTEEQRQGIMEAAAAHAWRKWMLINEKEAARRKTFPSGRRRPDPRTGKKRPRVYLDPILAERLDEMLRGRFRGSSRQKLVEAAVSATWSYAWKDKP